MKTYSRFRGLSMMLVHVGGKSLKGNGKEYGGGKSNKYGHVFISFR
ncbi:MAG: hypothetical protein IJY96_00180 [Oscillospiraceae bacterium]|nr:hypothetical protein [Oscillospiraceae bacterium]